MKWIQKLLDAFRIDDQEINTTNYIAEKNILTPQNFEIYKPSERQRERWEKYKAEKDIRKKQCDTFKIKDMYRFSNIPFEWNWVIELNHTNGIAWFMLNKNNQFIALCYIDKIKKIILDAHSYIDGIDKCDICTEEIDFDYPVPIYKDSLPNTYVECTPYTITGKVSKYPVILHFASSELVTLDNGYRYSFHPYAGEIKIMQDGNIGMADVRFGYTKFSIRLVGINLIIKRVDSVNGNLYKYML